MFKLFYPRFHLVAYLCLYVIAFFRHLLPFIDLDLLDHQLETPDLLYTHLILLLHDLELTLHVTHRILLILHLQFQLTHFHTLTLQVFLKLFTLLLTLPPRLGLSLK